MSTGAWLLVAWTVTFAAWLFTHAWLLVAVLRSDRVSRTWRASSVLVPLVAPIAGWRVGMRLSPIAWVLLVVGYVALRTQG